MLRYFWMLISVKGRIFLSLLLLVSLPLACLGPLFLYKDVDQPFEQIERVSGSEQQEIRSDITDALQLLGQHFKENKGQLDNPEVQYYYSQPDFGVAFTDTGVIYRLSGEPSVIVTLRFEGANPVQPEGQQMYAHLSHYFRGSDPAQWVSDVRSYGQVIYSELYDGIDLVYYFTAEGLKYDLVLRPGADSRAIRFRYEGIEYLTLNAAGSLTAYTAAGSLSDEALYLYQDTPAGRQSVAGTFTLYDATTFGFQIKEPYSSLYPLIVDPLVWSTLLGGSGDDWGITLATDSANNVYVTGVTEDSVTDFPTTSGAINETHNGDTDVFVCKLSADGSDLLYSTFLGGEGADRGYALAVDSTNKVYISGWTYELVGVNFPTTPGAINETINGGADVFVCKLSADGSDLLYSTFLGGSDYDWAFALALDSANNIYVTGGTFDGQMGKNFPTTPGAINETHNGFWDVFVCKISADGSSLLYSTFLGGSGDDLGIALAVDSTNNVYVTGITESTGTDFPTTPGAFDETHNGIDDIFVCKLSVDGSSLLYSTFLGGSGDDLGIALAVDSTNNVYVTGWTFDDVTDFPTTPGAFNETHSGGDDVFVCKLNADGSSLLYSTFLGGSGDDWGYGLAVDSTNNVYVTGLSFDDVTDFPTTPGAFNETHSGGRDVFVCKLSVDGSNLLYSTLLGGSGDDWGYALAIGSTNNIYVTGRTFDNATDFPTTPGAFNETHSGEDDVFVCKIHISLTISLISPINESIHQSGTIIDLIITDDGSISHVLYNWDGSSNTTIAAPYDLSLLSGDGQHILHVYANDTDGFWVSKTYVFTTDDTGPTIMLTSPTNGTTGAPDLSINLSITDSTGVSQVLYNWDGASNVTLMSPYDLTLPSSEGQHILYVYANDTLDNWTFQKYVFTTEVLSSTSSSNISTTSSTTPTTTPGLELLMVLTSACILVLFVRRKRQHPNH